MASTGIPMLAMFEMKRATAPATAGVKFCLRALRFLTTYKPPAPFTTQPLFITYSKGIPLTLVTHRRSGTGGQVGRTGPVQRSVAGLVVRTPHGALTTPGRPDEGPVGAGGRAPDACPPEAPPMPEGVWVVAPAPGGGGAPAL